jgi:hypothetical protein
LSHQEQAWRSIRADQTGGQGLLPVRDSYPAGGGSRGLVPHPFRKGVRDRGTGQKSAAVPPTRHRIPRPSSNPGMVRGIYPEMVREVPKAKPRLTQHAGAFHVAQTGGWGRVSATLVRVIGTPTRAAKSSLGY